MFAQANASIHAEDDLLDTNLELTDKGVVLAAKNEDYFFLSIPDPATTLKIS